MVCTNKGYDRRKLCWVFQRILPPFIKLYTLGFGLHYGLKPILEGPNFLIISLCVIASISLQIGLVFLYDSKAFSHVYSLLPWHNNPKIVSIRGPFILFASFRSHYSRPWLETAAPLGFVFVEQQKATDEYRLIVDALNHHGIHAPLQLREAMPGYTGHP